MAEQGAAGAGRSSLYLHRIIRVVKADKEEQERLAEQRDELEITDLEEALGFSRVINKLCQSGCPVLGHNMILDLAHTINQFCEPLPDSYLDFKALANSLFPKIIDTKLMANTSPFKQEILNSSLEELFKAVQQTPYSLPRLTARTEELGYSLGAGKYHEAAYDAFVTGLCFIAMSNRLTVLLILKSRSYRGFSVSGLVSWSVQRRRSLLRDGVSSQTIQY